MFKIDEIKDNTVQKVKNETIATTEIVRKKRIDILFQNTTAVNSFRLEEIYTQGIEFEIKNQEGIKIDFLGGFYQCFFKYKSDKNDLFKFLNDLKTNNVDISDKELIETDEKLILEKVIFYRK